MSKRAIGIALVVLSMVLASDAIAKKGGHGGGRGGGHGHFKHGHGHGKHHFGRAHAHGHHGGFARSRGHFSGHRFAAGRQGFGPMRQAGLGPGHPRHALNQMSNSRAFRSGNFLGNPAARVQVAAAAALAGWQGGAFGNGWWRHSGGGYGWVGPLFWPFAYNDIYDYALWGNGLGFWDYGYPDIYAGIFPPYGYSDLQSYFPQRRYDRRRERPLPLAQMCGNESRAIAGMPVDQIADVVEPTEAQVAALRDLGAASLTAAQYIRAACPAQAMLTAPGRLAVMQQRIEAMQAAIAMIRPKLESFYGVLNDEQKARLTAFGEEQRKAAATSGDKPLLAQSCSTPRPSALEWPSSEIEARIRPNDTQRAALQVLQDTSARSAEALKAACQSEEVLTPPARLASAAKRLDAMQQAVKQVRAALEDFYATLNDEQRALFEAIGPARAA